eukprot:3257413-Pleurochrysis_carterae.AAC.5
MKNVKLRFYYGRPDSSSFRMILQECPYMVVIHRTRLYCVGCARGGFRAACNMSSTEVAVAVAGELADLQKKYRIIESDRKNYSDESQTVLRKQRYKPICVSTACWHKLHLSMGSVAVRVLLAWTLHRSRACSSHASLINWYRTDGTYPPPSVLLSVHGRETIEKLKNDNLQLKEELASERKHAKLFDSVSAQAQIAKLQDAGDTYTKKIEQEKRRIEVRRACVSCRERVMTAHPCP